MKKCYLFVFMFVSFQLQAQPPVLTTFNPTTGTYGTIITINGTGFSTATGVTFGGTPATSFTVVSDTVITGVVGKASNGTIAVTNTSGVGSIDGFLYTGPPTITSLSPAFGPLNTAVTISGTGFQNFVSNNYVYFGSVKAITTSYSPTTLTVTAPAGSGMQPLTVTSNHLTAYSKSPFYNTFAGSGLPVSAASFSKENLAYSMNYFVTGDFNGDGKPDIAFPSSTKGVSFLRNTSTGVIPQFVYQDNAISYSNSYTGIAAGNLNGDKLQDLIVSANPNIIAVFINNSGLSSMNFPANLTLYTNTNSQPVSPIIYDMDGDGAPDIVVANSNAANFSIFQNSICSSCFVPTFSARSDITCGANPTIIRIADIDGDNMPDIIIGYSTLNMISVFRNISTYGNINFAPRVDITTAGSVNGLAVPDLDNDGKAEIVITTTSFPSGTMSVYANNSTVGTISFLPKVDYAVGTSAGNITAGDINGDAKPDLIITQSNQDTVVIFKNISTPGNIILSPKVSVAVAGIQASKTEICDLNLDGKYDIVCRGFILRNKINIPPTVSSFTPSTVLISDTVKIVGSNLTGATSITLGSAAVSNFYNVSDSVLMAIPSLPGSGDVVITNPYGSGTIPGITVASIPVIYSYTPASGPVGSNVIITGKGFSSLPGGNIVYFGAVRGSITDANDSTINVTVPGGASFQPLRIIVPAKKISASSRLPFIVTFPGAGASLTNSSFANKIDFICDTLSMRMGVGDLDIDGKPDLIIGKGNNYTLPAYNNFSVYKNTSVPGNVSFGVKKNIPALHYPSFFDVNDINGDGNLDVIDANSTDLNILSVFLNNTQNNTIGFLPEFTINRSTTSGGKVFTPDLDKDGRPDILYSNGSVQGFFNCRNTSNSQGISFGVLTGISDNGVQQMSCIDIDGDGKEDILTSFLLTAYRNTSVPGTISFAPKIYLNNNNDVTNLNVADFDNDGKPDIFFTSVSGNFYTVYRNTSIPGNISFAARVDSSFTNPGRITLGDVDGDGKIDILISRQSTDSIAIIKNLSTPGQIRFASPFYYKTGLNPNNIMLSDVDGDGKPDIITLNDNVVCCGNAKTFSVLRNRIGEPQLVRLCGNMNVTIGSNISGNTYQWQINTGGGYTDLADNTSYSGTNTDSLHINSAGTNLAGTKYQCLVNGFPGYEFSIVFENSWSGTVSNAWENPANWSCGSLPDINTDVIINSGNVVVNANTTIRSLLISLGASLSVVTGVTFTVLH